MQLLQLLISGVAQGCIYGLIALGFVLIKDGRLVEHWDVTQEEVPVELTKSGNPMFTPK